MQKFCFLILFLLAVTFVARAQTSQGSMTVGGDVSIQNTSVSGGASSTSTSFSPSFGYFIKDNWALGAQLSYGRSKRIGTDIDIRNIPEEISAIEESWGFYASTKNYLPLGRSNRFYLYNLVILGGRIENLLTESLSQDILTRTYTKNRLGELRIIPGIMINVLGGFTVEVGTGIAGFQASSSHTEVNGQPTTKKSQVSADLTIDLLRLSLGFYYYFSIGNKKKK